MPCQKISNFIIILLVLSLELIRRLLSVYRGIRSGISYMKNTETTCPLTRVKSYEGEFRKSADDNAAVAVAVKAYPMNKYPDSRLVHTKVQDLGDMQHIGKIYGTEVEGGILFVATTPSQATLQSHIEKFHTCPTTGPDFCRALIHTLQVLHDANIANRNIRPEHIVLDGCNVQLADFSHAKAFESDTASPADFIVDKHMLACTILYTLSGGLNTDGDPLHFDELMVATNNGFNDDTTLFESVKAGHRELADLLQTMVAIDSRLSELTKRPYFWNREQTVAYLGEEIGNLLDPQATKASPHYPFIEALEARGDAELGGGYSEELKQDGPSWAVLLDGDYPLTQGTAKEDPTGWGASRSAQHAPSEVEHTYAVYGKNPSAKQKTAREGHLKSGKKNMPMANRRMVGLLKTIRNVAFAHRSQHVQFGRFDTEEDVMAYIIDPFPWLLMTVFQLDQEHCIAGSVMTTASDKATDTVASTDDDAKAGYSTDGASKPAGSKLDRGKTTSGDDSASNKTKVPIKGKPTNKKPNKKADDQKKKIQILKEQVKTMNENIKALLTREVCRCITMLNAHSATAFLHEKAVATGVRRALRETRRER
jgi:serine/threonine protein kinase